MAGEVEYTIDDLARAAETTVRSVRVYHEKGLLPSPEVRGRIGYYSPDHLNRLQTISRLLGRGMRLNGIRELLEAWDRGDGLGDVLGVTDGVEAVPSPSFAKPIEIHPRVATFAPSWSSGLWCDELAARLAGSGATATEIRSLMEPLAIACGSLVHDTANAILQRLVEVDRGYSADSPADQVRIETDLAAARMTVARAAAELIERALERSFETPQKTPDGTDAVSGLD